MGFIFEDDSEISFFSVVSNLYEAVMYTIENYGWYLLIFVIIAVFIYNKKLKPVLDKYKNYRFEQEYAAKYHKNPDLLNAHVTAQQRFVKKLQDKYNKEAEEKLRQQKEKAERKRQEILSQLQSEGGVRLGNANKEEKKSSSLRADYNPLMGPGSSSNYRPPKRSACGGGGCGGKK